MPCAWNKIKKELVFSGSKYAVFLFEKRLEWLWGVKGWEKDHYLVWTETKMIVFREKKKYRMVLISVSKERCDVFIGEAEKVLSDNIRLNIMKGIAE